jgi:hypothetical protein
LGSQTWTNIFGNVETKTSGRDVLLFGEILTFEFFETLKSDYNFEQLIVIESPREEMPFFNDIKARG